MSVKAKLRALISAPFVSERSAPDWENQVDLAPSISSGTAGKEITYVPAADGYVSFAIYNDTNAISYARLNAEGTESALNVPALSGFSATLRVRKGNVDALSTEFAAGLLGSLHSYRWGVKKLLFQALSALSRAEVVYA